MALYGENLAKSIRPGTTIDQAEDVISSLCDGIRACYSSLSLWENWKERGTADTINLAVLGAIAPEDATRVKEMLDGEFAGLLAYGTLLLDHADASPEGLDAKLTEDELYIVRSKATTATNLIALCDRLFHTSVATQVSDAIVPAVGNVSDKLANVLSKAVGNFLAGIWWIVALAVVAFYFWKREVRG